MTEAIIDAFHNEEGTRPVSRKAMEDFPTDFVNAAMDQRADQGILDGVDARHSKPQGK
ncbi:hypothetical protein [Oceaniglobus ichthyenteri]|uniref:hypothetical protein n=1 Tax=Oceaniglobus ichthyenteri TaxID=2136177 RepID=UPI0013DE2524|nr:hypothetical protein [Oceaniglobus ichthyenteri]